MLGALFAGDKKSAYFDLLHSAYIGDLEVFKEIASGYDKSGEGLSKTVQHFVDGGGRGSLAFAAAGGRVNICGYLIEQLNLDVDMNDNHGITPLSYAAVSGQFDTVVYLLGKGANPHGSYMYPPSDPDDPAYVQYNQNIVPNTPLHFAVLGGDMRILTLLVPKVDNINVATRSGCALSYAALLGQVEAVEILLNYAHVDGQYKSKFTPLQSSIMIDSEPIMKLLLEAGARINDKVFGSCALTFAAHYGRTKLVELLVEYQVDANKSGGDYMTALEIAAVAGNEEIVNILFPKTRRLKKYTNWSKPGFMKDVHEVAAMKAKICFKEFFELKTPGAIWMGEKYNCEDPYLAAMWRPEYEAYFAFICDAAKGSAKAKLLASTLIPRFIKNFASLASKAVKFHLSLCKEDKPQVRLQAIRGLPLLCGCKAEFVLDIINVLVDIPTDNFSVCDAVQRALIALLRRGSGKKSCDTSWSVGFFYKTFLLRKISNVEDQALLDMITNEVFPLKNKLWQQTEIEKGLLNLLKKVLKNLTSIKEAERFLMKFSHPPDDDFFFESGEERKLRYAFGCRLNLPPRTYRLIFPKKLNGIKYDYYVSSDGSYRNDRSGWSVVMRNMLYKIFKVLFQGSAFSISSLHSEWEAVSKALPAMVDLEPKNILFVCDNLSVVDRLKLIQQFYIGIEGNADSLEKAPEQIKNFRLLDERTKKLIGVVENLVKTDWRRGIEFKHNNRDWISAADHFAKLGYNQSSVIEFKENEELMFDQVIDFLEEKLRLDQPLLEEVATATHLCVQKPAACCEEDTG